MKTHQIADLNHLVGLLIRYTILLIIANTVVSVIMLNYGPKTGENAAETAAQTAELQLKRLMLELVNQQRKDANLRPVILGDNPSAQAHADAALNRCYASHWDQWGLKPQHRYALAGGDQYVDENVNGAGHCTTHVQRYKPIVDQGAAVKNAVQKLAESPGHLENMMDPRHRTMHAGISINDQNAVIVQLFSADYVQWTQPPTINDANILNLAGNLEHARRLPDPKLPLVEIEWHPPPGPLSSGQLARTYCAAPDQLAATILPPPPFGSTYTHPETGEPFTRWAKYLTQSSQCVDPYDTQAHAPATSSRQEASRLHKQAKQRSQSATSSKNTVLAIVARQVTVSKAGRHFEAAADLSPLVAELGDGIYTIVIRATPDQTGRTSTVARYPVWINTKPPAGNPYVNQDGPEANHTHPVWFLKR